MKRIAVDEVVAAYAKTGLRPTRKTWLGTGEACGLSCLFLANVPTGHRPPAFIGDAFAIAAEYWADAAYGSYYCHGFVDGFDGDVMTAERYLPPDRYTDYLIGYGDGSAAAEAVFAETKS